jgi:hypothetical protein
MSFWRAACFATAALAAVRAQDTRHVEEPKLPPACTSMAAELHSIEGRKTLAEADEARPDTARIQHAIDACPADQAVALRPDGAHDAFLCDNRPCPEQVSLGRGLAPERTFQSRMSETNRSSAGLFGAWQVEFGGVQG